MDNEDFALNIFSIVLAFIASLTAFAVGVATAFIRLPQGIGLLVGLAASAGGILGTCWGVERIIALRENRRIHAHMVRESHKVGCQPFSSSQEVIESIINSIDETKHTSRNIRQIAAHIGNNLSPSLAKAIVNWLKKRASKGHPAKYELIVLVEGQSTGNSIPDLDKYLKPFKDAGVEKFVDVRVLFQGSIVAYNMFIINDKDEYSGPCSPDGDWRGTLLLENQPDKTKDDIEFFRGILSKQGIEHYNQWKQSSAQNTGSTAIAQ